MEEALQTPEIIRLIADNILGAKGRLAFALTRKPFLEPALDSHWSSLTSFRPLLACLPSDLYEFQLQPSTKDSEREFVVVVSKLSLLLNSSLLKNHKSFGRTLKPEDLSRYRTYYAPRIREFKPKLSTIFSMKAMKALRRATRETGALAPCIKRLSWFLLDDLEGDLGLPHAVGLMSLSHLFVAPATIQSIAFEMFPSTHPVHKFSHCPAVEDWSDVRELEIHTTGPESSANLDENLSFLCWARMEKVRVSFISSETLACLAALRRLTTLEVVIVHIPTLDGLQKVVLNDTTDRPFQSLRFVEIKSRGAEDILGFLQHLAPETSLRQLRITTFETSSFEALQNTISAIQHHCDTSTLETLTWTQALGPYDEPDDIDVQEVLDITPLLKFGSLKHLHLAFRGVMDVNPELLQRIPKAWPQIHSLGLCGRYSDSRIPAINHTHVLSLLRECQSIESLNLKIDTARISGPEIEEYGTFPGLKELEVGDSPIYSPSRVFEFIKAHFPRLKVLRAGHDAESLNQKRWDTVRVEWMEDRLSTNSDV